MFEYPWLSIVDKLISSLFSSTHNESLDKRDRQKELKSDVLSQTDHMPAQLCGADVSSSQSGMHLIEQFHACRIYEKRMIDSTPMHHREEGLIRAANGSTVQALGADVTGGGCRSPCTLYAATLFACLICRDGLIGSRRIGLIAACE